MVVLHCNSRTYGNAYLITFKVGPLQPYFQWQFGVGNPTPNLFGIFDENLRCEIAKFCSCVGWNTQMCWNIFVRAIPMSKFCKTYDLWIIANISLISFIGNMNMLGLTNYISQWEDNCTLKQVCIIFWRLNSRPTPEPHTYPGSRLLPRHLNTK